MGCLEKASVFDVFINIKSITNMTSRLKQSNLTALASTQKKTQEKSLE